MDMPATLLETHHLVEETRNQVAVKRGPVVYCLESADLPAGEKVFDIALPANIKLKPMPMQVDNGDLMALRRNRAVVTEHVLRLVASTVK